MNIQKFGTKKWYVIDIETKSSCSHHNPIKFLTKSIGLSLCDYSNAYNSVAGNITVAITMLLILRLIQLLKKK